jgi:hypothetical protein
MKNDDRRKTEKEQESRGVRGERAASEREGRCWVWVRAREGERKREKKRGRERGRGREDDRVGDRERGQKHDADPFVKLQLRCVLLVLGCGCAGFAFPSFRPHPPTRSHLRPLPWPLHLDEIREHGPPLFFLLLLTCNED